MVLASQLRSGMAIEFERQRYRIVAADYHPGQGQMGGVTHARMQNLDTRTYREHSFRSELRLQELAVERQTMQFLYMDGDRCCFMSPATFEQTEIALEIVGPHARFLDAGLELPVEFIDGRPMHVSFPDALEVPIAETAPPTRQQADSAFKPAKLANGVEVMVPQFIKTGDTIRIDLATLRYMDRAKEAKAKYA